MDLKNKNKDFTYVLLNDKPKHCHSEIVKVE